MDDPPQVTRQRHGLQILGSLVAAVLIVVGVVWAVTARLGPTSIAELEAKEEAAEEAGEQEEEAREAKEGGGDSGRRRRRGGRN